MSINYPASYDDATSLPQPGISTEEDDVGYEHDIVHANLSLCLIAMQAVLGIPGDSVPTTHDYRIAALEAVSQIVADDDYGDVIVSFSGTVWTISSAAITSKAAETTADDADLILIYDDSAAVLKKMTRADFLFGITGGGGTPGGSDTQVQFNDGGSTFGGDSGLLYDKTTDTLTVLGNIELGHASDTTISRTGAGAIAVEGVGVALNSISLTHTALSIELGHASDTTLSRSAAGVLAVEGVTVALNSITAAAHIAASIELGHASDTTLTRSSAGVLAVEGVTVSLNSTSSTHTAGTIELGAASDTTIARVSAGVISVEGVEVPLNSTSAVHTAGTIELGHASDTTIARSSAGVITVEGAIVYTQGGALGTPASGVATNLTGTASGLTAGNVTTNANLTGVITSSGNATSIASQTGTGTKFVVDTSPTLVTPVLGVATATSINKVAITAPTSSATLTIADGQTLTVNGSATITNGTHSGTNTGDQTASSLGLGTGDSPQFTAVNIGHATDTTITRVSAGVIAVEGKNVALNGTGEVLTTGTIELGAASDTTIARSGAGAITVEGVVVALNSTSLSHTALSIELGHASDTTIARVSSGDISVEGNLLYRAGGTDVPVTDGGTGASTLTAHGVVVGNGTSAVNVTATGSSGQVVTSNGSSADPTFQTPSTLILAPTDAIPATTDRVFPLVFDGTSTTGTQYEEMLGVEASVGADSKWYLYWDLPNPLPVGLTLKLRLWGRANATSGNAKVNAKWASITAEEDSSATTLNAEGTSTLSWGAGDAFQIKELLVTLDADTAVAGEQLIMALTFETSSWTLAAISGWKARLIWV